MMKHDARFSEAVAAAVTEIERTTDAEIVVVAAARSGSYADVSARAASVVSLVAAGLLIVLPWHLAPGFFLLDLALVWWLAERLLRRPVPVRALTRASRRLTQVREAAQREFLQEAVHGTPHRSGVLVYVSALEDEVELLPDLGVQGRIPAAELAEIRAQLRAHDLDAFLAGLTALGALLSARVPHHAGSDAFDLPNAPRVLS